MQPQSGRMWRPLLELNVHQLRFACRTCVHVLGALLRMLGRRPGDSPIEEDKVPKHGDAWLLDPSNKCVPGDDQRVL